MRTPGMQGHSQKHLYLLDIVRGLAALSVVIWHYQYFYFTAPNIVSPDFVRSGQPLYDYLRLFYEHGYLAVMLFFVLSGFVFFHVYYDAVRDRSVSVYEFFVYRFSRLYPLHFVTLVYVAIVQMLADSSLGAFIVNPNNDPKHFVLNLFFASNWGMSDGYSFNVPVWSVSVEILLYSVFFLIAYVGGRTILVSVLMMFWGYWMATHGKADLGWGMYSFFGGAIAYWLHDKWCKDVRLWRPLVAGACVIVMGALALNLFPLGKVRTDIFAKMILFGVCFPSFVFLLASVQTLRSQVGKPFKIIGDISYSIYLLHFPVLITVLLVSRLYDVGFDGDHLVWFLLYMGVVIGLSLISFRYFEVPVQNYLRTRLKQLGAAGGKATAAMHDAAPDTASPHGTQNR